MGIALVKAAGHPRWSGLSPFAWRVWVLMCTVALDPTGLSSEREPRTYYGGHDSLVLNAVGLNPGDAGYPSARRRVERAVRELREAGAIRLVNTPRSNHRANYTLHPDDLFTTAEAHSQ